MRIAVLTHGVSPFGHQLAEAFVRLGHEAEIISMTSFEFGVGGRIRMRVLGPPDFKPWETNARSVYLKMVGSLRSALRETRPDVLLALYLSSAGVLARLSGHPHVVVSALGSDVNQRIGSRFWRAVFRWVCRRAVLVHAVSEPLAQTLASTVGVDAAKLLVMPIGIDTRELAYTDPAARPNAGELICTRAHKPLYDHATLVRAMARLKARGVRCHLTFTSRTQVESTKALVCEHGVEDVVTFLPGYEYAELPSLLGSRDVYVSTSQSDGTSQSLLEALSTGTFPVVSDIQANRPWVEHGRTGLLFPPGDDAALADRLAEALARPDLRAAAAPLNRRLAVEKGDINRLVGRLLAAFERCLST